MTHTHHDHAHHRHADRVGVSPSLLRLSAWERLAGAGMAIIVLWAAVYWAVGTP